MKIEPKILEKARKIKLLLLDVDGVLADGRIFLGNHQEEFRAFHVHDGQGIGFLHSTGIKVGLITRRQSSELVTRRAAELKIEFVYQGQRNKTKAFLDILEKLQLQAEQVAYMGDDIPDLVILQRVGLSTTPKNGVDYVKERVDWISQYKGGKGAVRELCDLLLQAQGSYELAIDLTNNAPA
jgi:3-deoxy-D-manno-octulosonate 8-phosphate phosphatase (KDO 8-P phosphatase)